MEDDLKVGKSITIGSGPLKGYRGVIKSINKDRIEVRVSQKNCTEWINRDKISQSDSNLDPGKTPRRGLSMTTMYAQSPMNFWLAFSIIIKLINYNKHQSYLRDEFLCLSSGSVNLGYNFSYCFDSRKEK